MKAGIAADPVPGHIFSLMEMISPALEKAKGQGGNTVDGPAKQNINLVTGQIKSCVPILSEAVSRNNLLALGMFRALDDGKVEVVC
ncbi:MAG: hypothetical protein VYC17_02380 [Nitrospinota bacterium]|nr:hypothetical protein [Nitrospinota bacterium]